MSTSAQSGPISKPPAGFDTEAALLRYLGNSPPGYEWHHIIEQKAQIRPDLTSAQGVLTWIQNTANMVMVPVIKHYCVSGIMSSKPKKGDLTVRFALKFHQPLFQRAAGLEFLKICRVIQ
ncbi:MAG: hypothetical protein JO258_19400 [Alphaproteobacteria bacterium]|nr:hypothetical protein [Alphaproteobacteria bacterium]